MVTRVLIFFIAIIGVSVTALIAYMRKVKRVEQARAWPSTEATIQSAAIETFPAGRYTVDLPAFSFSYAVNGEYYSGRFALRASDSVADELVKKLADQKLTMHYDPQHPESHFIPNDMIEGCEVVQKLSDMPFNLDPEA